MAAIRLTRVPRRPGNYAPGLLLTAAVAGAVSWLGNLPAITSLGLGALTLAIIAGMVLGNTLYPALSRHCDGGVLFARQRLLRLGIILYGFRLTFQQIVDVGISGVVIDILLLVSTFLLACGPARRLSGVDKETAWLIGTGSSICGAAAILASEPVIRAQPAKVTVAVATVVIFGTVGIFLYPLLWRELAPLLPGVTPTDFGIYTGSTLHEVAQVVAAGHAVSPETENAAVITKMLRVMLLAPFLLALGIGLRHAAPAACGEKPRITFPWFALFFILVALFNSFHLVTATIVSVINQLDNLLLAMAMTALGLTTHVSQLRKAGMRPLLLGLILFLWLVVGGGAINLLVHYLMG